MGYAKRKDANKTREETIDYIMTLFPKDYSHETILVLKAVISSKINVAIRDFNEAFCEDNNLCPICVTGGWECDSDHK